MKNPFQFGKIIQDEAFCNRKEELKSLKKYILNGYSVWLYSPRRYGKTSLIFKAFRESPKVHTIYFDLYNIQSLEEFLNQYSEKITKSLFDWKDDIKNITQKISAFFTGLHPTFHLQSDGNFSMELDIKSLENKKNIETVLKTPQLIANRKNINICIAFDEFQEITHIHPQLVRWMRSVFQTQSNVSYIFLGSRQSLMESIFADTKSVFYEFGIKMNLLPIKRKDWLSFIEKKFHETNLTIPPGRIHEILDKSNGHPHFTQYFSAVVWDLIFENVNLKDKNFSDYWMNKIIESQSIIFQNIYDNLNINQRKILNVLAKSGETVQIFSISIKNKFKLPANSTLNIALKSLIKKDIIQKDPKGYKFVNPVLKEWIRRL